MRFCIFLLLSGAFSLQTTFLVAFSLNRVSLFARAHSEMENNKIEGDHTDKKVFEPASITTIVSVKSNGDNTDNEASSTIPALPLPSDVVQEGDYRKLQLGGSVKMDDLGPIIITPEGTTRRIANWDTMTKDEQATAWRLISARNKRRIDALKKQAEDDEENGDPPSSKSDL